MSDVRSKERLQEHNAKTMDSLEATDVARRKSLDREEIKRKDEAKDELLDQMDYMVPRTERSEIFGRSRSFSLPADAWEQVFGNKARTA